MQVTILPIEIGAFGTVNKGLLKGLEDLDVGGRVETIKATTLLGTARIQICWSLAKPRLAESAGAVEYTDCFTVEV